MRLNDAIAHAKKLDLQGKVYSDEHWNNPRNLRQMPKMKDGVTINMSDGTTKKFDTSIKMVSTYVDTNTPSLFTRDYLNMMFE